MMMAFRNVVCALNSLYYFPHSRDFISRHTLHVVILVIPRRQFIWGFAKKCDPRKKHFPVIDFVRGFYLKPDSYFAIYCHTLWWRALYVNYGFLKVYK